MKSVKSTGGLTRGTERQNACRGYYQCQHALKSIVLCKISQEQRMKQVNNTKILFLLEQKEIKRYHSIFYKRDTPLQMIHHYGVSLLLWLQSVLLMVIM